MNTIEIKEVGKNVFKEKTLDKVLAYGLGAIISSAASSFSILIAGPIAFGQAKYFLKASNKEDPQITETLDGINTFVDSLVAYIMITLLTLLWSLLFIIPGVIKAFAYSQTFFILVENPGMSGMDALRKSEEMMRGHKKELFLLQLSFFWWIIVVMLTFGLAAFYVMPYMQSVNAEFYKKLKTEENSSTTLY